MCLPFKDSVCFTLLCVWPFLWSQQQPSMLHVWGPSTNYGSNDWAWSSLANWNKWTDWSLTPSSPRKRIFLDHNNNPFYSIVTLIGVSLCSCSILTFLVVLICSKSPPCIHKLLRSRNLAWSSSKYVASSYVRRLGAFSWVSMRRGSPYLNWIWIETLLIVGSHCQESKIFAWANGLFLCTIDWCV